MSTSRGRMLAMVGAAALVMAGCGGDKSASPAASKLEGSITVSAASSLTEVFTVIGHDFTAANSRVKVSFNFDSSSTLSGQILEGAPADVFASADEANMVKLTDAHLVAGPPEIFARNEMTIVTKPGNPAGITGLADLAHAGVVSLCGEAVPCGNYAKSVLELAGVSIPDSSITRGETAKATLTAVSEGDAVAGIVFVTDARAAGDNVDTVTIPDEFNVTAAYPIAVLASSENRGVAEAFKAYVLGATGQSVLDTFGFLPRT